MSILAQVTLAFVDISLLTTRITSASMTVSLIDSEIWQADLNDPCFVKLYSTLKHIHSWPHRRKTTMVVASSPHQLPTSSRYALGHCPLSAKWLVSLSEGAGIMMRVYVKLCTT